MKRSLLVAAGTVAGVTAAVSFHASADTSVSDLTASTSTGASGGGSVTHSAGASRSTSSSATRSAVGRTVTYPYGRLQAKVTERRGRIVDVSLVTLHVDDAHSAGVASQALPRLEREVIAAQSVHIDGVSGASYTVQAYKASVQSALDRL